MIKRYCINRIITLILDDSKQILILMIYIDHNKKKLWVSLLLPQTPNEVHMFNNTQNLLFMPTFRTSNSIYPVLQYFYCSHK